MIDQLYLGGSSPLQTALGAKLSGQVSRTRQVFYILQLSLHWAFVKIRFAEQQNSKCAV